MDQTQPAGGIVGLPGEKNVHLLSGGVVTLVAEEGCEITWRKYIHRGQE